MPAPETPTFICNVLAEERGEYGTIVPFDESLSASARSARGTQQRTRRGERSQQGQWAKEGCSCQPLPPTRSGATRQPLFGKNQKRIPVHGLSPACVVGADARLVHSDVTRKIRQALTQPSTNGVSLVPASNHGVRGTCRKPVLGLAPRRLLTSTRAHSCSRPLGRAEHVFCETAQAPTFSQWVLALGLIHPHVTLDCALHSGCKASKCPHGQRRRTVSACSQSLACAITLKAHSGLLDTQAHVSPTPLPEELEWRSPQELLFCTVSAHHAARQANASVVRHRHPPRPRSSQGRFRRRRSLCPRTTKRPAATTANDTPPR